MLQATGLQVTFGATKALDSASFAVGPGEAVAVVGRSGSGKSTLLHCLAGLVRPDAGTVALDGTRIDDCPDEELTELRRSRFGFVFQFGELVSELPLLENVALPLRFAKVRRRAGEQRARAVMDELGIGELAGRRPGEVSGGQLQRAAVARALVHRPSVVFADEPTGALDSDSADVVLDALLGLTRSRGTSVVLVTHDRSVASRADRSVTVRDGRTQAAVPGAVR